MRYTVLTKRNKSITPSPAPAPTPSNAAPSRRSTPANTGGRSEILILHPESYYSRSSTGTPVPAIAPKPARAPVPASAPESAPTSASQAKLKPRPRARRKQPTPKGVSSVASDSSAAGPSNTTQQEQPTLEPHQETGELESTEGGSKGLGSGVEGEEVRPNKRQRTEEPSSVPATQSESAAAQEGMPDTSMENSGPAAKNPPSENAGVIEGPSAPDTLGRGRGRNRGRGCGSGRGPDRPRGWKPEAGREEEERASGDAAAGVPVVHSEPGPSAGPPCGRTIAPTPTRRQPPRAANKASRPGTQQDGVA